MKISVIIPTYRRSRELRRCLDAIREQARQAEEVMLVIRNSDEETKNFLRKTDYKSLNIQLVMVEKPGQVEALNAGLKSAKGEIIVFTDDDAMPHIDWLKRIETHFELDPKLGALGGCDALYINGQYVYKKQKIVGKILWFGRIVGNHHSGVGKPRCVDHLKGSNMSFRYEAINNLEFDNRLRGDGAQYRNDLAISLAVKRKGWKNLYDPGILVDHYYAQRYEDDIRGKMNLAAVENASHNETLVFLDYLSFPKNTTCLLFSFLVGSLFTPGILQWLRLLLSGNKSSFFILTSAMKGRWQGWKTWLSTKNEKI